METTPQKTKTTGQAVFVPIKNITDNLEEVAVGHAGIYPVDNNIDNLEEITTETIEAIIAVGTAKGRKILLDVEDGIKTFIQDGLASKKPEVLEKYGLSKDMERIKAIPDKMTGVLMYYLTKGIEKDFGITWDKPPVSLQARKTKIERDIAKGKRVLSKKEKNELLAKTTWDYWGNEVSVGNVSKEQALAHMREAIDKVEELKHQGLYLSPNKTEGVKSFDWKSIVEETCNSQEASKIYTKNKIEIIIPNIMESVYNAGTTKIKQGMVKDLLKSELIGTVYKIAVDSGIKTYGVFNENDPKIGGFENTSITSIGELIEYYKNTVGRENDMKELQNDYKVNSIHLVKMKAAGMMKPRWVCWDLTNNKTNERQLWLMDKGGARMIIKG